MEGLVKPSLSSSYQTGLERGLPISCFGIDVADSIHDIGAKNLEMMLLAKHGGGVGIGINQIRPAGVKLQVMEHLMVLYHSAKIYDSTILQLTRVLSKRSSIS